MAKIILSAFVTQIAGSVGGTTFRRNNNSIIVQNKQQRQLKSFRSPNNKIFNLSQIVKSWNSLNKSEKNNWNSQAALFPVKDNFGNQKTLRGRDFFIKQNGSLLLFNANVVDPLLINNNFDDIGAVAIMDEYVDGFVYVYWGVNNPTCFLKLYIFPIPYEGVSVNIKNRKPDFLYNPNRGDYVNVYSFLVNNYSVLLGQSWFRVCLQMVNPYGMKSDVMHYDFQIVV